MMMGYFRTRLLDRVWQIRAALDCSATLHYPFVIPTSVNWHFFFPTQDSLQKLCIWALLTA